VFLLHLMVAEGMFLFAFSNSDGNKNHMAAANCPPGRLNVQKFQLPYIFASRAAVWLTPAIRNPHALHFFFPRPDRYIRKSYKRSNFSLEHSDLLLHSSSPLHGEDMDPKQVKNFIIPYVVVYLFYDFSIVVSTSNVSSAGVPPACGSFYARPAAGASVQHSDRAHASHPSGRIRHPIRGKI
jgi:hypothetical protein